MRDLIEFFSNCNEAGSGKRKTFERNFMSRTMKPLLEKGFLSETEDGYMENMETVDRVFVESGGQEHLQREYDAIKEERTRQREKLKRRGEEYEPGALHDNQDLSKEKVEAYLKGELDYMDLSYWEKNEAGFREIIAISAGHRAHDYRGKK